MIHTKKILSLALAATLILSSLTGCKKAEKTQINMAVMTGPTAIGMIKIMEDAEKGTAANDYKFNVFSEATEVSTGLIKGELDIACVPANLASVLYNKTEGNIIVAGINTLGVLYLLGSDDSLTDLSALKGKKIYSTGQGTTPEYTLRYILSGNNIDPDNDVEIEYKAEAAEVVAAMAENPDAIAMLPQPYVTVAMNNNENLKILFDITKEWEKISTDSSVVTGVVVVRKEWLNANKKAFEAFLKEYPLSAKFANDNVEQAAELIEKHGIFKAAIAKKAIPYCNVTFIDGTEMKSKLSGYLNVLFSENPQAVGGKLPGDDFYYSK